LGSGKGSSENNQTLENAQVGNANALTTLLNQQSANSQSLFNLGMPGLQQSEGFYGALASGSPQKISEVIAPATQQITQATQGAKQNIMNNSPAGGEKNLALEQTDVNQGAQVGSLASQGFTSAFPALAQLGGANVNEGISSAGTAISAGSSANQSLSNVVQQNIQQKGATLGAFGGLAGDASTLGAAGITSAGAGKGASALGALAFA